MPVVSRSSPILAGLFLALAASGLSAQGMERDPFPEIPPGMLPPEGKCRIWMEGVPASQQPAPTDCQTALRNRSRDGFLIFGPPATGRAKSAAQLLRELQEEEQQRRRRLEAVLPVRSELRRATTPARAASVRRADSAAAAQIEKRLPPPEPKKPE